MIVALLVLGLLRDLEAARPPAEPAADPSSDLFATARLEANSPMRTASDGDLWPSCWADDDALYAANGDGYGFSPTEPRPDIAVCRLVGPPDRLTGETLAIGDAVASIWTPGGAYNRKPTGMACVDGVLYLAVQDLARDFNDAPAASISRSDDHGRTWHWDRSAPMFRDHRFTTIMFLDYGRDGEHAPDGYVYAYGLDGNWRDSFNDRVDDPTALYLARVPRRGVQDRSQWRFFAGLGPGGEPTWSADLDDRRPVLSTERRVYRRAFFGPRRPRNLSVISQGGVVYNAPLRRYLYTSWTEYTFEFYEAPAPWGPWRLFLSRDFGGYPWTGRSCGGYATTIPSKFIGEDGRTMYVQSNTFVGGVNNYGFSLRRFVVTPGEPAEPENRADPRRNLARDGRGVTPVFKSLKGEAGLLNDGDEARSLDDLDGEDKPLSWWGYTWDRSYRFDMVRYTSGRIGPDGGWFAGTPRVQVRRGSRWEDVGDLAVSPDYPGDESAGAYRTYTFRFRGTAGDGVRILGRPGGTRAYTSVGELGVFYAGEAEPR